MEALLGLVRHSGNAALFQAVEMSILSILSGVPLHLHSEGLRGTGKTTILRAARRVLPRIRRITGCLYNCEPAAPHCPLHRDMGPGELAQLGSEWVPMPFLEISHSAKIGTVVGSVDLARLVRQTDPAAALLPGTLPQAHRGIVFVDEINRLAETSPELADVLLDVMGTKPGRVQIEETGLPAVELPLSISVWAASNPDEDPGPLEEIRRQLSDRFDFVVPTSRPGESAVVAEILSRFDGFAGVSRHPGAVETARLEAHRARTMSRLPALRQVETPAWLCSEIAEIYARFGLESLRAAQAMLWGVKLAACQGDRKCAQWEDLAAVVPMALHHRVDGETLARVLQHVRSLSVRTGSREVRPAAAGAGPGIGGPGVAGGAVAPAPVPIAPPCPTPAMAIPEGAPRPGDTGSTVPGRTEAPASGANPAAPGRPGQPLGHAGLSRPSPVDPGAPNLWHRLWQSLSGRPPGSEATGARGTVRDLPAGWSRPETPGLPGQAGGPGKLFSKVGPQRGGGSDGRSAGDQGSPGEAGPTRMVDPTQYPPAAPPAVARPISLLTPAELVRTEPELQTGE